MVWTPWRSIGNTLVQTKSKVPSATQEMLAMSKTSRHSLLKVCTLFTPSRSCLKKSVYSKSCSARWFQIHGCSLCCRALVRDCRSSCYRPVCFCASSRSHLDHDICRFFPACFICLLRVHISGRGRRLERSLGTKQPAICQRLYRSCWSGIYRKAQRRRCSRSLDSSQISC